LIVDVRTDRGPTYAFVITRIQVTRPGTSMDYWVWEYSSTDVTDAGRGSIRSYADKLSSTRTSTAGSPASECLRNDHTVANICSGICSASYFLSKSPD
jgi:hypothetical protein